MNGHRMLDGRRSERLVVEGDVTLRLYLLERQQVAARKAWAQTPPDREVLAESATVGVDTPLPHH